MAKNKTARTAYDFKEYVLQLSGSKDHFEFMGESDIRRAFWIKLNGIGARNIKEQPPQSVPNIDATVTLSDEEWEKLDSELQQLL